MSDAVEKVEGGEGAAVARPDFIPETAWDATTNSVKLDALKEPLTELGTLREFKTTAEAKAAEVAATKFTKPEDVEITLPEGFELPGGQKFVVDPKDPIAVKLQHVAVERGWGKPDVAAAAGVFVDFLLSIQAAEASATAAAAAATESGFKEFGDGRPARVAAVKTWVDGGPLKDHAAAFAPLLGTAAGVKALETVQAALKDPTLKGLPGGSAQKGIDITGMSASQIFQAAGTK